ncbi:hypothetical protein WwAna0764 [Wolbachia endosymbiont of Drosophila ananassae]|nr:hypothetical protein WwAna0764 [Wolbachia endosymbiont of Drosophila ananassae]
MSSKNGRSWLGSFGAREAGGRSSLDRSFEGGDIIR